MPRQAIRQATCPNCDSSEDNFDVKTKHMDIEEQTVEFDVQCTCRETGTVTMTESGIESSDNISHENASWNQEESDE